MVTNPPPFYPTVTRCGSTRETMLLCTTWWMTQRGVHTYVGRSARPPAAAAQGSLQKSMLFLRHTASSGAFLWSVVTSESSVESSKKLPRSYHTMALADITLTIPCVVLSLKCHELISFFVLLAICKLQFYILVSDRPWVSREGTMRTGGCFCKVYLFLQPSHSLYTQLSDTKIPEVAFGRHCVAYLVIWASSKEGLLLFLKSCFSV